MLFYFFRKFKDFAVILSTFAFGKDNSYLNKFLPNNSNVNKELQMSHKIYCAGPLFNQKDLIGNLYLADAIYKVSNQRYTCVLPQNLEQRSSDPKIIKNNDLKQVRDTDAAIFSFDGTDPDSGTVTEFIQAKFLDKPAVLYRSDFRAGGDTQKVGGDPWNLMMSNYPRTISVIITDLLPVYQTLYKDYGSDTNGISENLSDYIAKKIVNALDLAYSEPSIPLPVGVTKDQIYDWFNKVNDITESGQ